MIKVLAVDDEEPFRRLLKKELTRKGFYLNTSASGDEALQMLADETYDVVLLDIMMPGMDGITLMKKINSSNAAPMVVVLTGKATVETAVEAMKSGAFDYMTKPFKLDEIEIVIRRAYEFSALSQKSEMLEQELIRQEAALPDMVGSSKRMQDVMKLVRKVAPSDSTVLVLGESGTGKELISNSIWKHSKRNNAPFIALNCATLSNQLIESELFGHEKGSFTTAYKTKYGIVETVNNGTLLLDEIGELPLELQPKILRFLDSGEFRRVGGNSTLNSDVRVIAATNRNLQGFVDEGKFREDLYYRLNVFSISMPSLKERIEDLEPLVDLFIKRYSAKQVKKLSGISPEALKMLKAYNWPGNIRELENVIERAVILSESDIIDVDDLTQHAEFGQVKQGDEDDVSYVQLDEMERSYIEKVLNETGGNQTKASQILGINRKTLYHKIKKYGLGPTS
jgi:DNA-binding NtrC family response regulator